MSVFNVWILSLNGTNLAGIIAVKMPSEMYIEENTYLNTDKNNKIQQ